MPGREEAMGDGNVGVDERPAPPEPGGAPVVDEEEGALLRRRPEAEVLPELAGVVTAEAGAEEAAGADSVAAAAEAALEGAATSEGAEADATSELEWSPAETQTMGAQRGPPSPAPQIGRPGEQGRCWYGKQPDRRRWNGFWSGAVP